MKSFFWTTTAVLAGFLAIGSAYGDAVSGSGAAVAGPLAGLNEATAKLGLKDHMPAKLCGMLWPAPGGGQHACAVKKISVDGIKNGEKWALIVRMDNRDLLLAHFTETMPHENAKTRREYYYRTTPQGDLALALTATFHFTISDTDTDILKDVTCQIYSDAAREGAGPLPITPEIKAQFESAKKMWLSQEKKLKKEERELAKAEAAQ